MAQQIKGYQEALRELGRIDKTLQKHYKSRAKDIMAPGVAAVKAAYPTGAPLSGLERRWAPGGRTIAPWTAGRIRNSVRAAVYTRKRARTSLAIVISAPIAQVVEFAGKRRGNPLGDALDETLGQPGRIAWPAFIRQRSNIQLGVMAATQEAAAEINRRLAK